MKRIALAVAGPVYEWANHYVDRSFWSYPYYFIALAAAAVLDRLDPVLSKARSGQTS